MSLRGYPDFGYPSDTLINGYQITFEFLHPNPGDGNFYPHKATFIIE